MRNAVTSALGAAALLLFGAGTALGAPNTVESRRSAVERLEGDLAAMDARAGVAAAAHNRALERLQLLEARSRSAVVQLRRTRADLSRAQDRLASRLVAIYVQPQPGLIDLVLSGASTSELSAAIELTDQISRSDASLTRHLRGRREELAALRRRLAGDRRRADQEAQAAAERRRQVQELIRVRRERLANAQADLRAAIAAEDRRLAALAAEKRASQAARAAAARAPARPEAPAPATPGASATSAPITPSAGSTTSTHVFPIQGATTFSDDWLASRGGGSLHEGIDLFAARGTPVVAVADGSLYNVGWNALGGWRLWLRDGTGTTFYYAHLDSYAPAAQEGASVSRGTLLGYVGDSGDAKGTSPHVHFEIHPGGGGPVRPYPIVAAWPRP